ncbi:TetR/AcrR family transcriptional regulator [Nocardiopsis flavescens]
MVTRSESAAATRSALVRAASELLDEGGPEAVTLRAVGARAGVSRGAPYGHFEDKAHLLAELAVDAWSSLADTVERLRADEDATARVRLERAVLALIGVARSRPHVYALMFAAPADDPVSARAAERLQDQFLTLVADVVGEAQARGRGALVMAGAHGIAGLELSGHLAREKWGVGVDDLVRMLVEGLRPSAPAPGTDG